MWLTDVVSLATIQSTWGNQVRNHLVQTFDTISERDSHAAALPDGAVAYVTAVDTVFMRRAASPGGWRTLEGPWVPFTPTVLISGGVASVTVVLARFKRSYGTVDVQMITNFQGTPSPGTVAVNLPVAVPAGVGVMNPVIGLGSINSTAYTSGPVITVNDGACQINGANGQAVTVSAAFITKLQLRYEGIDG